MAAVVIASALKTVGVVRARGHRSRVAGNGPMTRRVKLARVGAGTATSMAVHRGRRVFASAARREAVDRRFELKTASDVAAALGDMKGLVMKLGQMASFMSDDIPESMRVALATLQQDGPPMSPGLAAAVVVDQLGRLPERAFAEWDPTPIAAASIGQVHRAITTDGMAVAVKVQYPGVAEAVEADLRNADILRHVAALMFKGLDPAPIVEELRVLFTEELDYHREAANQAEFAARFADHPFIDIPQVRLDLSSARVLTTELATGARLSDVESWSQDERNLAGETIFRFGAWSLDRFGLLNGDSHPGNYLFRPGGRVTFLDFGLVRREPEAEREIRTAVLRASMSRDPARYRHALERVGTLKPGAAVSDEAIFQHFHSGPRPVLDDSEFTYTPEFAATVVRRFLSPGGGNPEISRWLNLAPSSMIVQRRHLGVNAVLGRLHATANWHRVAREIWPWCGDAASTPLGEEEAPWRRLHSLT